MVSGSCLSAGAETSKKRFKIPSGKAIITLKEAAKQADVDIMFAARIAQGVRTNAIEGEFVPLKALDLMLSGTPLTIVEDRETGAFAVIRSPLEEDPNSITLESLNQDAKPSPPEDMKKQTSATGRFFAGLLAVLVADTSTGVYAQEDEEDVYELTPFEVSSAESQGYIATSTLAGTRMRMDLDDVGSAISVFTEELMNDIGAVDNESLLAYGLGTEVGGARGNFINPNTQGLENENLLDPQSNNRIRGLTNADSTRNYFKSDIPWDGYNTYRIDVQRGANSILFGLGSPAGIINNSTNSAVWANENRIRFSIDKFDSYRLSGTFNRVLWEDELAVRVDFLMDNKEFRQHPAFEDDERVYLTFTYQPEALNNESTKTSFSASYEDGSIRANRPRMVVPLDFVSEFFIPTSENGFQGADFANGGVFGPNTDINGPGGRTYNTATEEDALSTIAWLDAPNSQYPVFAIDATNPSSGFSVYENGVYSKGSYLVLQDPESDETTVVTQNGGYINPYTGDYVRGVDDNVWQANHLTTIGTQRTASNNGLAFPGFWRDKAFSSTDQFDYYNHLIDGENKLEQQDFEVLELQVRNTFLNDRIGYQLSYFKQDLTFRQDANMGTIYAPIVQVEANSQDALGDDPANLGVNPTAGRAYVDFETRLRAGIEDTRNREAKQAQVFARIDAEDFSDPDGVFAYIFGSHNFTGLLKNRELERFRREFNSIGPDEATIRNFGGSFPGNPSADPDFVEGTDDPGAGARMVRLQNAFGSVQPRIRVYLDAQGPQLTRLQPFTTPNLESGNYSFRGFQAMPVSGFTAEDAAVPWLSPNGDELFEANNPVNYTGTVANKGTIGIVKATDSPESLEYLTGRRFYDIEDVDTKAAVWSGSFLNDALVGMYGWREDKVAQGSLEHDFSRTAAESIEGQTGGPNFDPNSSFIRRSTGDFQSRNWSAKLNVTRLLADWTGIGSNLPFDVGLLYNEGEVQNPQPGRRDILLRDLPPATGRTIDRSLAISTKDGRYSLRVTKYDTVQANANAGNTAASENWRIEQAIGFAGTGSGVALIENRTTGWNEDLVLDNGDDVDDPGELSEARSDFIRAQGFNDPLAWGDSIAAAFRNMQETIFTRWPAANSWVTGGALGTDTFNIIFPDDTVFIEDNESFGTEIEFTARPTDNWNLAINAAKTEVLRTKVFSDAVNEVIDYIVGELSGPAGQVPMWGPEGTMLQGWVAPFSGELITNRALLGTPTGELRKWRINAISSYDFTEGALAGFGVGAGIRYEDSQVIGFPPRYVNPVTGEPYPDRGGADAALSVDIDNPYRDNDRWTYDLWLRYDTKLSDKINWRIQLNVFNVTDDHGTVPLWVNPDGAIATRGIREGRSWQLTNTFEF